MDADNADFTGRTGSWIGKMKWDADLRRLFMTGADPSWELNGGALFFGHHHGIFKMAVSIKNIQRES